MLCIPKSSSITGTSPSNYLVSYPGHSMEVGSYFTVEMQLLYSAAPADRATMCVCVCVYIYIYLKSIWWALISEIYIYIYIYNTHTHTQKYDKKFYNDKHSFWNFKPLVQSPSRLSQQLFSSVCVCVCVCVYA